MKPEPTMSTVTVPDHAPRCAGDTLTLRTDRPAWIVRWEGWLWCSLPVVDRDGDKVRVFVPVRLGIETAIANGMAVEVVPENDDPVDRPVRIRPAEVVREPIASRDYFRDAS